MKRRIKKLKLKRRLEGKTDYKARASLLKAELPRFVVRKSNSYIVSQIVKTEVAQDKVVATSNSRELEKYGWQHNKKNISASYLTGFLIARKVSKLGITRAVLDIGIHRSTKGSRIYACLKGAIDGGLNIPYSEEVLPSEERLRGVHIKENIQKDIAEVINKIKAKLG